MSANMMDFLQNFIDNAAYEKHSEVLKWLKKEQISNTLEYFANLAALMN